MTLAHETIGSGPNKVIVTHNWMATIRCYDAMRPLLDEETFTYAFVDLRGYGLNKDVQGLYSAVEAAADLIGVADALDRKRFHMVGHSMSGMIAQRVCVDAGARVQSLAAITPANADGMPLDGDGQRLFTAAVTSDAEWLTIARMLTSARLPERWYCSQLRHFRENVRPEAALGFLQMFSTTNFAAEMPGLRMPALAILGRHDFMAFTEEAMTQTLGNWLPSLTVEVIESAGHHPMLETP